MSTEKKYRLTHDFEHLSRELFNELSRENGFTVERALEGEVVVLTVEKKSSRLINSAPFKYRITLRKDMENCVIVCENTDTEAVWVKYVKAFFILGIWKILSLNEDLEDVNRFPTHVDDIVVKILTR